MSCIRKVAISEPLVDVVDPKQVVTNVRLSKIDPSNRALIENLSSQLSAAAVALHNAQESNLGAMTEKSVITGLSMEKPPYKSIPALIMESSEAKSVADVNVPLSCNSGSLDNTSMPGLKEALAKVLAVQNNATTSSDSQGLPFPRAK